MCRKKLIEKGILVLVVTIVRGEDRLHQGMTKGCLDCSRKLKKRTREDDSS